MEGFQRPQHFPVIEEAPPQPRIVVIPELPQPLLDENVRREEIFRRLSVNSIGHPRITSNFSSFVHLIYCQIEIEKRVEAALVYDGFSPLSLIEKRHQIRGFLFYPQGTVLSPETYSGYCRDIASHGTRGSVPYRRILRAVQRLDLFL
jgi:hypothetical protein